MTIGNLASGVSLALTTVREHKMRSFLMLLGIILSVATLIVVVALISGVNQYIATKVANLGSNAFTVMRYPVITEMEELVKAMRRNKLVTWDDYEALRQKLKLPARVGAEVWTSGKSRWFQTTPMLRRAMRGKRDRNCTFVFPGRTAISEPRANNRLLTRRNSSAFRMP